MQVIESFGVVVGVIGLISASHIKKLPGTNRVSPKNPDTFCKPCIQNCIRIIIRGEKNVWGNGNVYTHIYFSKKG